MTTINLNLGTKASIKRLIVEYEHAIDELQEKIAKLQAKCSHEDVFIATGSSQGNYDPSQDDYWYVITCKDCGSVTRVYESKDPEGYRYWARRRVNE